MWRLALAVAVLASCNPRPTELHRLELPGFSVEVPPYVKAGKDLRYNDDEVDAESGIQRVTILWHAGKPLPPDQLEPVIGKAMDEAMEDEVIEWDPARAVTIGGQKASRLDGGFDGISAVTIVDIACGDRSIMFSLVGLGIRNFRERLLESFLCKPDPAEEAKLASAAPVGSDDPAAFEGFRHVDDNRANFTITNDVLTAVFELEHATTDAIENLQDTIDFTYGMSARFTPEGKPETRDGRTFYRGAIAIDKDTTQWAVGAVLRCNPESAVISIVGVDKPGDRAAAIEWLGKLRCAKPSDPPLAIAPAS